METQLITIPITTDMDASQLLDIVNTQISQMLEDEIESSAASTVFQGEGDQAQPAPPVLALV